MANLKIVPLAIFSVLLVSLAGISPRSSQVPVRDRLGLNILYNRYAWGEEYEDRIAAYAKLFAEDLGIRWTREELICGLSEPGDIRNSATISGIKVSKSKGINSLLLLNINTCTLEQWKKWLASADVGTGVEQSAYVAIGNEVNADGQRKGYSDYSSYVNEVISLFPDARLVVGETSNSAVDWLVEKGLTDVDMSKVTGVSIHPYQNEYRGTLYCEKGNIPAPGQIPEYLLDWRSLERDLRCVKEKYPNQEIWVSEIGWSSGSEDARDGLKEEKQAEILVKALVATLAVREEPEGDFIADKVFWFQSVDVLEQEGAEKHYGIISANSEVPPTSKTYKPSYYSFRQLIHNIGDSILVDAVVEEIGDAYFYAFLFEKLPSHRKIVISWLDGDYSSLKPATFSNWVQVKDCPKHPEKICVFYQLPARQAKIERIAIDDGEPTLEVIQNPDSPDFVWMPMDILSQQTVYVFSGQESDDTPDENFLQKWWNSIVDGVTEWFNGIVSGIKQTIADAWNSLVLQIQLMFLKWLEDMILQLCCNAAVAPLLLFFAYTVLFKRI